MPVQNKACMERYIQKCQERHKQKVGDHLSRYHSHMYKYSHSRRSKLIPQLRDMKCSIDNKCPRAATHLKTKAKKNALMEDRFAQIETENRLLLEKMSHIMRVSFGSNSRSSNRPNNNETHPIHAVVTLVQRRH